MRRLAVAFVVATTYLAVLAPAHASAHSGCNTHACLVRVCKSYACKARVARKRAAHIARSSGLSAAGRAWAWSTAICESGYDPPRNVETGNGFVGMFQWTWSTWYAAGGRGSPMSYSFEQQAPIAWRWHLSHPSGQWPVCGE